MNVEEKCEMMKRKPPKISFSDELEIEDENEKIEFDINIIISRIIID